MILLDRVTVTYADNAAPALTTGRLGIGEGELVLVVGTTGSGKSTLLRTLNGLVPHFTGGHLGGSVIVDGRDTRDYRPRDLAEVVGYVHQNPAASFVTDRVEDEIAYGMETLGIAPSVMRRRVEDTLDLLGIADLRARLLVELSGGQQQRVAIAAVLAAGPHVLVLDEPTSALDPVAAEEVLSAVQRLVHDHGLTVVLAEHRLERVIHHADRIVLVESGVASDPLPPAEAMARSRVFPPVVELGRYAGWSPLPLSVRQARRVAGDLRARCAPALTGEHASPTRAPSSQRQRARLWRRDRPSDALVEVRHVDVSRGGTLVLDRIALRAHAGDIVAITGRNGSGKSTLLWTLAGQLTPSAGTVSVAGVEPSAVSASARIGRVGLVPQDPADLLYADSVAAECADADRTAGRPDGTTYRAFTDIAGDVDRTRHPRDLSEGQRLALAIALVLSAEPTVLLLDEPTRGLDYPAKARLVRYLRGLAERGACVLLATHDVELVVEVATRVVLLADGAVVADDSPAALADSTAYAPQVARIMHPVPLVTVDAVRRTVGDVP